MGITETKMAIRKNFNTKENWDKKLLDLQSDPSWVSRRKDWADIARTSIAIDEIVRAIQKYAPEAKSLLEIGPGDGYVIFGLSKRIKGMSMAAMDISQVALDMTTSSTPEVRTILGSMETMDLGEKFDVILTAQTLEHSDNINEAIYRIGQHLNPGGILIVILPYMWEVDEQHNYKFDDNFMFTLCKRIGRVELIDTSVQYQSKIVVVKNVS